MIPVNNCQKSSEYTLYTNLCVCVCVCVYNVCACAQCTTTDDLLFDIIIHYIVVFKSFLSLSLSLSGTVSVFSYLYSCSRLAIYYDLLHYYNDDDDIIDIAHSHSVADADV